jgi:hypothetical protein
MGNDPTDDMRGLILLILCSSVAYPQVTLHHRNERVDTLLVKALTDSGNVTITGWAKGDSAYFRAYGNLPTSKSSGTASFVGANVRAAVYLAGITTAYKFGVGPVAPADLTFPVTGDVCSGITKTDTLVVMRLAGTTSGLEFWYQQVKP